MRNIFEYFNDPNTPKSFYLLSWVLTAAAGAVLGISIISACPFLYKSPYEMRVVTVSQDSHIFYHGPKYGVDVYQDQGVKRIDILGGVFYTKVIDSWTGGQVSVTFDDGY